MRPSRRLIVVTLVAIACGAAIVGVALDGLQTPEAAVTEVEGRVLPAIASLDDARTEGAKGQALFLAALASPAEQRGGLVADAQAVGARTSAAWRKYQRDAYGSEPELRLQRRYAQLTRDGQSAGADVFANIDSPGSAEYQAAATLERELAAGQVVTLDEIERRFYSARLSEKLTDATDGVATTRRNLLIAFGVVLLLGLLNAAVHLRGALRQEELSALRERESAEGQRRADLENQLQRGLEMEPAEEDTYSVIATALALVRPDAPTEVLLADSPRAHFRQVLSTDSDGDGPGCPVASPLDCPAASSGQTRLFLSGTRLDACPSLRGRDDPARSAACFPVSIAGTMTGVIHTTGPDGALPSASELADVELVARKAGERIGFLRVLARTQTQARIDSLTGLLNRRSIERAAQELLQQGSELVVAYADLDFFKKLNDEHGHDAGDRALRLFGRVLRDSVRPSDVPGRYGGEEFVILLPNCTLADAEIVVERIRLRLASAMDAATAPEVTVSIGLAAWVPPETFTDTVARADAALLEAKATGRDRMVLAAVPDVIPAAS